MGNTVAAIFVDAIVVSQAKDARQKMTARLADKALWSVNMTRILKRIMAHPASSFKVANNFSESVDYIAALDVKRAVLHDVLARDPDAIQALDALDIDPCDHPKLADILDY